MTRFYQAAVAALFGLTGTVLTGAEIPNLTFRQVPIPQPRTINPQTLAAGLGGKIWFTDRTFRQVGYVDADNSIHAFKLTDSVDPANEVRPLSIVEGPDGNAWFTLYITNSSGTTLNRSAVARATPRRPDHDFSFSPGFWCGITVGPDGNIWFVETVVKKIGRITVGSQKDTPVAMANEITELPAGFGYPLYIAAGDIPGAGGNLLVTR